MSKDVPKIWNSPDLTAQIIDGVFDEINARQDSQYKKLSSFFIDPRTVDQNGERNNAIPRTPVVLLIDSTKIEGYIYKVSHYLHSQFSVYASCLLC